MVTKTGQRSPSGHVHMLIRLIGIEVKAYSYSAAWVHPHDLSQLVQQNHLEGQIIRGVSGLFPPQGTTIFVLLSTGE